MGKTKYPIGIQTFESLRNDGYIYIDKTMFVNKLVSEGRYYFLSRPRRFGKSLLVSTLQSYFEGKRELFKGLYIDRDDVEWVERPVIRLDFNAELYNSEDAVYSIINRQLFKYERKYGLEVNADTVNARFENLIQEAHEKTGHRVAILVDEYDKPMLQAIGTPDLADTYREILKAFYGVMKSSDQHIKFAFLTGVTKFSKVSIFSDLNNINDITPATGVWTWSCRQKTTSTSSN